MKLRKSKSANKVQEYGFIVSSCKLLVLKFRNWALVIILLFPEEVFYVSASVL